ncbi:MAG: hypothetical protein AAB785_00685 [Patescibacteria group bacterium]
MFKFTINPQTGGYQGPGPSAEEISGTFQALVVFDSFLTPYLREAIEHVSISWPPVFPSQIEVRFALNEKRLGKGPLTCYPSRIGKLMTGNTPGAVTADVLGRTIVRSFRDQLQQKGMTMISDGKKICGFVKPLSNIG